MPTTLTPRVRSGRATYRHSLFAVTPARVLAARLFGGVVEEKLCRYNGSEMMITVIGRGHGGTRAMSHTLSESGVYMGATLNGSGDLIPPEDYV